MVFADAEDLMHDDRAAPAQVLCGCVDSYMEHFPPYPASLPVSKAVPCNRREGRCQIGAPEKGI